MARAPAELDALIEGMAKSLATVLNITDEDVSTEDRVIHVLNRERNFLPDKARLDGLKRLQIDWEFAMETADLAEAMAEHARVVTATEQNLLLAQFAVAEGYNFLSRFNRTSGGHVMSQIIVGGIGALLRDRVYALVIEWLHQCDRTMTLHFEGRLDDQAPRGILAPTGDELNRLIEGLSLAIAKRICLTEPENAASDAAYELSTIILEQRGNQEVSRARSAAESRKEGDLHALRAIMDICRTGATSERTLAILSNGLHHIDRLYRARPIELDGQNARVMNLEFLHRVCQPIDIQVKVSIVKYWLSHHGACANTAAQQAIAKLQGWKPEDEHGFVSVVVNTRDDSHNQHQLPAPQFVRAARSWFLRRSDAYSTIRRTGLDSVGRRIVRITSLVLELTARGEFERGVVSPEIVQPIAYEACFQARYAAQCITQKKARCAFGCKLLNVAEHLADAQSVVYEDVRKALCSLSHFSVQQIMTFFSADSPDLAHVQDELSKRVRAHLVVGTKGPKGLKALPDRYTRFALDALPIVLPIIDDARKRLHIDPFSPSNPIADMLRTAARVRQWRAEDGPLRLDHKDLQSAHPDLIKLFKECHKQKTLVHYYRPWQNGRQFTRPVYELDSLALRKLVG